MQLQGLACLHLTNIVSTYYVHSMLTAVVLLWAACRHTWANSRAGTEWQSVWHVTVCPCICSAV